MAKKPKSRTQASPIVYLSRRATFSAAHRLHSPKLSEAENRRVFGKCNNPRGHGHNYELEVILRMAIDPQTGMALNLTELKSLIEERVCSKLDHKHLEEDTPFFRALPSTAENLAVVCWRLLEPGLPKGTLFEVRIRETENNLAFYRGE